MNLVVRILVSWMSQGLLASKMCTPKRIPGKEAKITSECGTWRNKGCPYPTVQDSHPRRRATVDVLRGRNASK